jgi:hypothetical protein
MSRCCGEAYLKYVEGGNPRRTPLIGKITIYGWKLSKKAHLQDVVFFSGTRLYMQYAEYLQKYCNAVDGTF